MYKSIVYMILLSSGLLSGVGCQNQARYDSQANEIFPAVPIKYAALFRMDQLPISPGFFRDRWTAMIFASASCAADCRQRLVLLDGVTAAQTLLVIDDLADHAQLRALKKDYPSVAISMGTTAASLDNFIGQFVDESIPANERKNFVFLINPNPEFSYTLDAGRLKPGDIDRELDALKKLYLQEQ